MASCFLLEQGQGLATKQKGHVHGFVSSEGIMVPSLGRRYRGERVEKATFKSVVTMVTSVKVSFEMCSLDFLHFEMVSVNHVLQEVEASGYDDGPL